MADARALPARAVLAAPVAFLHHGDDRVVDLERRPRHDEPALHRWCQAVLSLIRAHHVVVRGVDHPGVDPEDLVDGLQQHAIHVHVDDALVLGQRPRVQLQQLPGAAAAALRRVFHPFLAEVPLIHLRRVDGQLFFQRLEADGRERPPRLERNHRRHERDERGRAVRGRRVRLSNRVREDRGAVEEAHGVLAGVLRHRHRVRDARRRRRRGGRTRRRGRRSRGFRRRGEELCEVHCCCFEGCWR
mmetsp:Transcript_4011/g.12462  ORF Transcript_4011/g.12462 Transcript_4011/m.12462 type:complete len:244 (-) Transcript_4011:78-809(-)